MHRLHKADLDLCIYCNRGCKYNSVVRFFSLISRLGDGIFWYSLVLILPFIYGQDALLVSIHMALTGIAAVIVYKVIKRLTGRKRPCNAHEEIFLATDPLDYYSFPSGHTLHAVSFTIVVMQYYPDIGLICIPFTICVAFSRVVLGLHYPTDVFAGAGVGTALAVIGIQLFSY